MPVRKTALLVSTVALVLPGTAAADYAHVVAPGESLTSVAATDGLSVSQLAAANRLSTRAELIAGQVIEIPARNSGWAAASTASATVTDSHVYMVQPGDTLSAIAARIDSTPRQLAALNGLRVNGVLLIGRTLTLPGSSAASATDVSADTDSASVSADGSYRVQLGDTLSAIAARAGTSVSQLAALNGLSADGVLIAGTTLKLPSGTGSAATGAGNQQITADASDGPYPTPEYVSGSQVGAEAEDDGLSPSLAEAIGWQESGYNNDVVSPTGAVGVMQIEPATWSWINTELTPSAPLNPSSAYDNVEGGVLLLHALVDRTGSDSLAAAAYYQGLQSVEENGEYASTEQYVADVAALQARFGGG